MRLPRRLEHGEEATVVEHLEELRQRLFALRRHADELQRLAAETHVCLGGAGAARAIVGDLRSLTGDPVDETELLTQLVR